MNRSTLKPCSCYKHTETGPSLHRWLLWVFLALLLTNPVRESQDCPRFPSHVSMGNVQTEMHGRPQAALAMCPQAVGREKCMAAAADSLPGPQRPEFHSSVVLSCQPCPGLFWVHQGSYSNHICPARLVPEQGVNCVQRVALRIPGRQLRFSCLHREEKLASRAPCRNK